MTGSASDSPLSDVTTVTGDAFVISASSGDVHPGCDHGLYVRDTRFLDRLQLLINDLPPQSLASGTTGPGSATFHAWIPQTPDRGADPTVTLTRRRTVDGGLREEIALHNHGRDEVALDVAVLCGTDFAYVTDVKHRHGLEPARPRQEAGRLTYRRLDGIETTEVRATPAPEVGDDRLTWRVSLPPRSTTHVRVDVVATDAHSTSSAGRSTGSVPTSPVDVDVRCSDPRLEHLVRQSLDDLTSLTLADPESPDDLFFAAGTPWYLTLFGRDSIWAAFMALPFDLQPARGTLRALARRQGRRVDDETEEGPGKIPHEVRWGGLADRGDLPPVYYGTIDATPLFVILAHEAWRWGLPDDELVKLLPAVDAALAWMRESVAHGSGFLTYIRHGERGLDNQGWKDSRDGIQFADGRIAEPPIVLCEAQGYAYDAALRGADLLDHLGRPDGDGWRQWAAALRSRFHDRFWVEDDRGPYVAIALDRDGAPVDGVASNMGHLLMTGILDEAQAATIAARLAGPAMNSGWGLRTLSSDATGYNPLSYHAGSVWPHDTAITAWGCARTGNADAAAKLIRDLLDAGPHFDYRLPELFSGAGSGEVSSPIPYPASCRPQAWSAGASLMLLRACLGLEADVPDGRLRFAPLPDPPFHSLELRGLRVGGDVVDVYLREGNEVNVLHAEGLEVVIASV